MNTGSPRGFPRPIRGLILLLALCGLHPSFAQAATSFVPADHPRIQAAIDAAAPGDMIVVAPGTYPERIDFLGKAITLRSAEGPLVTIIDGTGLSGPVVQCVSGEGPDSVLEGFTITGGNADFGGGMLNIGSSPTVIDSIFSGNVASERGGGMYNREGNPTIIGSTFELNSAQSMGGGMFNTRASPTITDCRFTGNTATKGAGMRNYIDSHPRVTNALFDDNHAGEEGGGMDNRKNSNPVVTNSRFIGNSAGSGGGGMHNYVGRATATGNPTIINSLFTGNAAPSGGAMRNNDPSPIILNSTFAFNQGTAISSRNGSAPSLKNCIVWGNSGGSFGGQSSASSTVTYSNIEGGFPGTGNLDLDPLFVAPGIDDYHLSAISLLIDAGDFDPLLPASDLDGNPRIVDGIVDMGAYEFGLCPVEEEVDNDLDGFSPCGGDCDDNEAGTNPSASEICDDGLDNNCNGMVDEGCGAANLAPVASFGWSCLDLQCSFTDGSSDSDGSVIFWSWDFGDGSGATAANPSHTYGAAGSYAVTLTVTDDDGDSGSSSQNLTVIAPASDLAITGLSPDTVFVSTTVNVTVNGSGFAEGTALSFGNGEGPPPVVTATTVEGATTIAAVIQIKSGGPPRPRAWDVTVTLGGASATLPDGLTVVP